MPAEAVLTLLGSCLNFLLVIGDLKQYDRLSFLLEARPLMRPTCSEEQGREITTTAVVSHCGCAFCESANQRPKSRQKIFIKRRKLSLSLQIKFERSSKKHSPAGTIHGLGLARHRLICNRYTRLSFFAPPSVHLGEYYFRRDGLNVYLTCMVLTTADFRSLRDDVKWAA